MRVAGFFALGIFAPIFFAGAAELININTADAALLDTLPGIGPAKAQAIIDYRTANGPFAAISDIQNVSGIGASTYADIAPLITVGSTSSAAPASASSTPPSGSAAMEHPIPPPSLSVEMSGDENALLGVPARFSARAVLKGGATDTSARILWSFGDGSSQEGTVVEKTYRYAGTYLVTATAYDGTVSARKDLSITAAPAQVRIAAVSGDGITIENGADKRLDLSGWWLANEKGSSHLPPGTALLPGASVLFPFSIVHLPVSFDARLLYPDGAIAARYDAVLEPARAAETAAAQLQGSQQGYEQVQTVGSIISSDAPSYDEAVSAPAETAEAASAGAATGELTAIAPAAVAAALASGLLRSPWVAGLLGVILVAGTAFIFI